ncbi:hypothetical protein HDK77DRAFT_42253 [Phyllosticta capitalensis]
MASTDTDTGTTHHTTHALPTSTTRTSTATGRKRTQTPSYQATPSPSCPNQAHLKRNKCAWLRPTSFDWPAPDISLEPGWLIALLFSCERGRVRSNRIGSDLIGSLSRCVRGPRGGRIRRRTTGVQLSRAVGHVKSDSSQSTQFNLPVIFNPHVSISPSSSCVPAVWLLACPWRSRILQQLPAILPGHSPPLPPLQHEATRTMGVDMTRGRVPQDTANPGRAVRAGQQVSFSLGNEGIGGTRAAHGTRRRRVLQNRRPESLDGHCAG